MVSLTPEQQKYVDVGYSLQNNPNIPQAAKNKYYDQVRDYVQNPNAPKPQIPSAATLPTSHTPHGAEAVETTTLSQDQIQAQQTQESIDYYTDAGYPAYGGVYSKPDLPVGAVLTGISEEKVAALGDRSGTRKPKSKLVFSYVMPEAQPQKERAPFEDLMEPSPSAGMLTPAPGPHPKREFTPEETRIVEAQVIEGVKPYALGIGAALAAPVLGPAGLVIAISSGVGISQGFKAIEGKGFLTPQEVYESATLGVIFSGVGSKVLGAASRFAPEFFSPSANIGVQMGSRSAVNVALAGGGSYVLSGGNMKATEQGAMFGGAFSVAGEIGRIAGPTVNAKVVEPVKGKIQEGFVKSEMGARLGMEYYNAEYAARTGDRYRPSFVERAAMRVTNMYPQKPAVGFDTFPTVETVPSEGWVQQQSFSKPRNIGFREGVGFIQEPSKTIIEREPIDSIPNMIKGNPSKMTAGLDWDINSSGYGLSQNPVELMKPISEKIPMGKSSQGMFVSGVYVEPNKSLLSSDLPEEVKGKKIPESLLSKEYKGKLSTEKLGFNKFPKGTDMTLSKIKASTNQFEVIPEGNSRTDAEIFEAQKYTVSDRETQNPFTQQQVQTEKVLPKYVKGYSVELPQKMGAPTEASSIPLELHTQTRQVVPSILSRVSPFPGTEQRATEDYEQQYMTYPAQSPLKSPTTINLIDKPSRPKEDTTFKQPNLMFTPSFMSWSIPIEETKQTPVTSQVSSEILNIPTQQTPRATQKTPQTYIESFRPPSRIFNTPYSSGLKLPLGSGSDTEDLFMEPRRGKKLRFYPVVTAEDVLKGMY
jgi:hypothetical protein